MKKFLIFFLWLQSLNDNLLGQNRKVNCEGSLRQFPPGPEDEKGHTITLPYEAFGPEQEAAALIGMNQYEWIPVMGLNDPSCFDAEFDIRVIVYRDRTLKFLKRRYPTVQNKSDYRLVRYSDALKYLDQKINSYENDIKKMQIKGEQTGLEEDLVATLKGTRKSIAEKLGK